jgi:hypothetical protein
MVLKLHSALHLAAATVAVSLLCSPAPAAAAVPSAPVAVIVAV